MYFVKEAFFSTTNNNYYSYLSHTFLIITAEKILSNQENLTGDNFTACLIMCVIIIKLNEC